MKLFINNIRVKIVESHKLLKVKDYDIVLNSIENIDSKKFKGKVLFTAVNHEVLAALLILLDSIDLEKIDDITFAVENKKEIEAYLKSQYKVIKAAGGIVLKEDEVLLIYRLGSWDLPKGKIESGEVTSEAAQREVEEECGVKTEIVERLGATWHTYTAKEKKILKKSTWYIMRCTDDTQLLPQLEEGIEQVKWFSIKDARKVTKDSYASVSYILKKYSKIAKLLKL